MIRDSSAVDCNNLLGLAQGRVWTGRAAISRGLVDALGGVATAVELAKERVRLAAGVC